ncbi:MAG TPA: hypothetical protein VJJ20_03470 [Candidatus Paceibacterota bacterium]
MSAYTTTDTESFTLNHARQIASRVAADLLRFQDFYGAPSTGRIDEYEAELVELLKHDVVEEVIYGFKRNGNWTLAAIKYNPLAGGVLPASDDPGKIKPNLDITGAHFGSFLSYRPKWYLMSPLERARIRSVCPIERGDAVLPGLEQGSWAIDRFYGAGGRGLQRSSVRI